MVIFKRNAVLVAVMNALLVHTVAHSENVSNTAHFNQALEVDFIEWPAESMARSLQSQRVFTQALASDLVNREVSYSEMPLIRESVESAVADRSDTLTAVRAVEWTTSPLTTSASNVAATEVVFTEGVLSDSALSAASDQQVISPQPAESVQGRRIIISNVEFKGNEVIDSSVLKEIASPFVGRRIGFSDLEELRIQLTKAYVDRGYVNSGALLPDQKVEAGNIVYQIVEGDISEINIEGDGDLLEVYIKDRLLKDAAEPLNAAALQENFQMLLDDPLIERMDGQFQDLPGTGATAFNLNIVRARPYDLSVAASNHGSLSLGAPQLALAGLRRNITGVGDNIGVSVVGNQNKYNFSAHYEIPIDSKETRVRAEISTADSTVVEEPFDTVEIESKTSGVDIAISRDLARRLNHRITVGSGFAVRENANTLDGRPFSFSTGEIDGKSRVSVARVWGDVLVRGEKNALAVRGTANMGMDMFGSTIHEDTRPGSEFLKLQGQIQYSRQLFSNNSQLLVRVDTQFASTELLPMERFSLGGASSVRGYRENEMVRDQAAFASVEFRYPFLRSSRFGNLQAVPFVDMGLGTNKGFFEEREQLVSVGLGLLWDFRKHFLGELYIGVPLRDVENSDGTSLQEQGVHLKLSAVL